MENLEDGKDKEKTDEGLVKILKNLTDQERRLLIRQLGGTDRSAIKKHRHHYPKNHARFGYMSDSHIGHKEFREDLFVKACRTYVKEGIDTVYLPGDILEGMSGRDGHIYELSHIGFSAQVNYAAELFGSFKELQFYAIDGNHDEWYVKKNNAGLIVGEQLEEKVDNYHFLGQMEADVVLAPKVTMKLFHGRDGTAYAVSYKMQKLMESMTGGEKPSIILSGHYHKHLTMWNRNIFGVECGTLCGQTPFMRGKKIPAHLGFGLMDVWYNGNGVQRVDHTFFPGYS